MTRQLPSKPSLEQLRKQAKDIIKAHKKADPSCCTVLRRLKKFEGKSDEEILKTEVGLQEAQFALAMEYGFKSWGDLTKAAIGQRPDGGRKPSYSDLRLRGDGFTEDSFCLAIEASGRLLGKEIEYERLLAMTSNAFAPGFDTGNVCKELWVVQGWVSHIGVTGPLWRALGLRCEAIHLPQRAKDPNAERQRHLAAAQVIRDTMGRGMVVVTSGGWEHRKQFVEPWWAGIVTEVTPEGDVLGAHLNGRTDNVLADLTPGEMFAVSLPETSDETPSDAVELLRVAVARSRAEGVFKKGPYTAFGIDAMDEWITQMRDVQFFCPPCQENKGGGWESAALVGRSVIQRSRAAARYLREFAGAIPQSTRSFIEAAAEHYDAMVDLLLPAVTKEGYKEIVGDIDKQKEHADKVLVPVKNELAKAADEMEKTLMAME